MRGEEGMGDGGWGMGDGGGGVAGSHVAQIKFGELTPYLTYGQKNASSHSLAITRDSHNI
jgi:hypothetical protein